MEAATSNPVMPIKAPIDLSLYLVINPEQCVYGSVSETAVAAVDGGVTAIQLRSKTLQEQQLETMVNDVADALKPRIIPVFVNDNVGIAISAGVKAVHLGQEDMNVKQARELMGDSAYIGLTVRSMTEAENAPLDLLDYVSVGGVFPTSSKSDSDSPIGISKLREIVEYLRGRDSLIPVIAISGITKSNIESVLKCGVDGVAVVSAICEAKDPKAAAQHLRAKMDTYKKS